MSNREDYLDQVTSDTIGILLKSDLTRSEHTQLLALYISLLSTIKKVDEMVVMHDVEEILTLIPFMQRATMKAIHG